MSTLQLMDYREYLLKLRVTEANADGDILYQSAMLGWTPSYVLLGDILEERREEWTAWLTERDIEFAWNQVGKNLILENESDAVTFRMVWSASIADS